MSEREPLLGHDWLTYDWPADGVDPFDPDGPDPLWVLMDGAGLWGRGWPAGDRRDFASWTDDFCRRVPMGYKVIEIRERVALLRAGDLLHASARSATPSWFGQWGAVGHLGYGADPRTSYRERADRDRRRAECATEDEVLAAAARLSLAEPEETWLVSRRIAIANWH